MAEPRGHKRITLVHDIARGEKSSAALMREYGMTRTDMKNFLAKYNYDIQLVQADLESEYAGLWITNKRNRLAEVEEVVNSANAELELWRELVAATQAAIDNHDKAAMEEALKKAMKSNQIAKALMGGRGQDMRTPAPELMKIILSGLKQAAEEMGDLHAKVDLNVAGVRHEIVGIDAKDLT